MSSTIIGVKKWAVLFKKMNIFFIFFFFFFFFFDRLDKVSKELEDNLLYYNFIL